MIEEMVQNGQLLNNNWKGKCFNKNQTVKAIYIRLHHRCHINHWCQALQKDKCLFAVPDTDLDKSGSTQEYEYDENWDNPAHEEFPASVGSL